MTEPVDHWVPIGGPPGGLKLHIRQWEGQGIPFVLLHGLASNCLTWEAVARNLNAAGHPVVTVDQRGHGLSDKPASGYGFEQVTGDLLALLDALRLRERPIVAGQSWGGNVVLDFAARYPGACHGLVLVDGGFIELASRPGATWESISVQLKPPALAGSPRLELATRFRQMHPDWSDEGIAHSLGNFETLPDGTIRPWLTLDRHMEILRALWEHRPSQLYAGVEEPVLITPADTGDREWSEHKRERVEGAADCLKRCHVRWFPETAHDIHVHRPQELAQAMLEALREGFFDAPTPPVARADWGG
ncbi:MAG: alpha/beta hydrolase [Chloroflexi bacterium]|nr:alpha/beta hydrolase [Chloroflexota bacterium]